MIAIYPEQPDQHRSVEDTARRVVAFEDLSLRMQRK